jgi:hypothetical protein
LTLKYGMLDNSWNHRMVWTYKGIHAQYLSVDSQNVYGIKAYTDSGFYDRYAPGRGYILFAQPVTTKTGAVIDDAPGEKSGPYPKPYTSYTWWKRVHLRVQAMVRAGDYLFVAGPPDVLNLNDPFAAFEGRAGGSLWTMSTTDGDRLAEYPLASPPVFDGLAAANSRLYISTMDGSVLCLGQP